MTLPPARTESSSLGSVVTPSRSVSGSRSTWIRDRLPLECGSRMDGNRLDMKGAVLLVLSILLTCICVDAQDYAHLELGPIIGLTPAADGNRSLTTDLGGRVVANFSGRSALDFQLTVHKPFSFTSDDYVSLSGSYKLTFRNETRYRLNFFGLAGFGVAETSYSRILGSSRCCLSAHKYHPAMNLGGGVEFVPIRHVAIRGDSGLSTVFLRGSGELPSTTWNRPILQVSAIFRLFR